MNNKFNNNNKSIKDFNNYNNNNNKCNNINKYNNNLKQNNHYYQNLLAHHHKCIKSNNHINQILIILYLFPKIRVNLKLVFYNLIEMIYLYHKMKIYNN